MTYEVAFTPSFKASVKTLEKRYRNIKNDLQKEMSRIIEIPEIGTPIALGARKARCANSDSNRGKRGGYRIIYYVEEQARTVYFMFVYSKSEKEDVTEAELRALMSDAHESR